MCLTNQKRYFRSHVQTLYLIDLTFRGIFHHRPHCLYLLKNQIRDTSCNHKTFVKVTSVPDIVVLSILSSLLFEISPFPPKARLARHVSEAMEAIGHSCLMQYIASCRLKMSGRRLLGLCVTRCCRGVVEGEDDQQQTQHVGFFQMTIREFVEHG